MTVTMDDGTMTSAEYVTKLDKEATASQKTIADAGSYLKTCGIVDAWSIPLDCL